MEVELLLKSKIVSARSNRNWYGSGRVKTENSQFQDAPEVVIPIAGFIANQSKRGIDLR